MKIHTLLSRTIVLLFLANILLAFRSESVKGGAVSPVSEPTTTGIVDFLNGTRMITIDYQNGTRDQVMETFIRKTAKLRICNSSTVEMPLGGLSEFTAETGIDDSSSTKSLSLTEEPDLVIVSMSETTEQEMLLGFTLQLLYVRQEWNAEAQVLWWKYWVKLGIEADFTVGLRLPFQLVLSYPRDMAQGENYTVYAAVYSLDRPDFDELVCGCTAVVWVEADLPIVGHISPCTLYGTKVGLFKSFATPIGSSISTAFLSLEFDLFDLLGKICPELEPVIYWISKVFVPYLVVEPTFGSEKITANITTVGDARVFQSNLTWSYSGHELSFTVNADDHDTSTDYAKIKLYNFRYYFTELGIDFKLRIDFEWYISQFLGWDDIVEIKICTLDLSWIIENLFKEGAYVGTHGGYPDSAVSLPIYVYRVIPPPEEPPPERIDPRDITFVYASVHPNAVFAGQIVDVTVVAANTGNKTEDFNVDLRYNGTEIGAQYVHQLPPNQNITLVFTWDTKGLPPCSTFTVIAEASTVPDEIDKEDNILVVGEVKIKMPCDINGDTKIDLKDVYTCCSAYGTSPGHNRWNPDADVNLDKKIDLVDIFMVHKRFGICD